MAATKFELDPVAKIHGSIPAFAYTQEILYPPDTASKGLRSLFVAAFGPAPRLPETMKRCTCTMLNQISPRSTPPSIRRSVYALLTTLPFHHQDAVTRAPARTCTHNDLRACVPPVSEGCRSEGGEGGAIGRIGGARSLRHRGEEAVPVHAQQYQPCLYPRGMARGNVAQTYRSASLTTSTSPRWLVLHPRASELLAIFITIPSHTGYVERSVNRTDVVRV